MKKISYMKKIMAISAIFLLVFAVFVQSAAATITISGRIVCIQNLGENRYRIYIDVDGDGEWDREITLILTDEEADLLYQAMNNGWKVRIRYDGETPIDIETLQQPDSNITFNPSDPSAEPLTPAAVTK